MAEATFAARIRCGLDVFSGSYQPSDPEFMRLNSGIFESEDLVEAIYSTYIALIANGWRGTSSSALTLDDIGSAYVGGFYLPCADRTVLAGQIDLRNDPLPNYAGLVCRGKAGGPAFLSVRRALPPRGVIALPGTTPLAVTAMFRAEEARRRDRATAFADMEALTNYVCVSPGGTLVPALNKAFVQNGGEAGKDGLWCQAAAAAINAWADARHLWNVETGERVGSSRIETPLRLGVSEEHVKSLFYARSAPVTEGGRKRPILHWVRAHARRLREGVDVDVQKHLRGTEVFEMEGFTFSVTNPTKRPAHH